MSLINSLKKHAKPKRAVQVWKGPEEDGITYSLLSRFLCCRERFRLLVAEGLKPKDEFNARMEFGNLWHVCEEAYAKYLGKRDHENPLTEYSVSLTRSYPFQKEQINHWYNVCKALFPLYIEHWGKHPDVMERTPLFQEQVFDVPYQLPSRRTVRLRGKWDSVDLIGKGKEAGIYLQENKTKSTIDERKIVRQLTFDLQTMLYLVAMEEDFKTRYKASVWGIGKPPRILGVRYNVIRRSAHKSVESMLKKLEEDRVAGRIGEWFARWKIEVSVADATRFRRECLDPILENLCWWWEDQVATDDNWIKRHNSSGPPPNHWRHPYGVYNVLDEGGSSELDYYLETGNEVGLQRVADLFPEL